MPDVDLNFLARQSQQIINEVGVLRDENRVLTAMVTRLEGAQPTMLEQMRALQSLILRMAERFHYLEAQITQKVFVDIDAKFEEIQRELSTINERLGVARPRSTDDRMTGDNGDSGGT